MANVRMITCLVAAGLSLLVVACGDSHPVDPIDPSNSEVPAINLDDGAVQLFDALEAVPTDANWVICSTPKCDHVRPPKPDDCQILSPRKCDAADVCRLYEVCVKAVNPPEDLPHPFVEKCFFMCKHIPPRPDPEKPKKCRSASDCAKGQVCDIGGCGDDEVGVCKARPRGCPRSWKPVCGCDNETYANKCRLLRAGKALKHTGACDKEEPCKTFLSPEVCAEHSDRCEWKPNRFPLPLPMNGDAILPSERPISGAPCVYNPETGESWCPPWPAPGGECIEKRQDPKRCGPWPGGGCEDGEFCNVIGCLIGASGTCEGKPDGCFDLYDPVCGCDGETYGNDCERKRAEAGLAHRGECKPDSDCTDLDFLACREMEGQELCKVDWECPCGPSRGADEPLCMAPCFPVCQPQEPPQPTCSEIAAAYRVAVDEARQCVPYARTFRAQCQKHVPSTIVCGCMVWVNEDNALAVAKIEALQKQYRDLNCLKDMMCPAVMCMDPGDAGTCTPTEPGGKGRCGSNIVPW